MQESNCQAVAADVLCACKSSLVWHGVVVVVGDEVKLISWRVVSESVTAVKPPRPTPAAEPFVPKQLTR